MTNKRERIEFLQGTLDILILRSLQRGPAHGHALAKHIKQTSQEVFHVETGSLYPALHRLEAKGWIAAEWGKSENNRRAKYYSLTRAGRKQLDEKTALWERIHRAITLVLETA